MMTSPSELSFDSKPQIYSMLPKSFGDQQIPCDQQTQKLEEFVARLEEEKLKIDAFKRELPLCMQLLTNAMEASRQQLQSQRTNNNQTTNNEERPILEQFIPLKNNTSINSCNNTDKLEAHLSADKANWMTSAQLWNQESEVEEEQKTKPRDQTPLRTVSPQEITEFKLGFSEGKKVINGGGAFQPFSSKGCGEGEGFPELALANSSSHKEENIEDKKNSSEIINISGSTANNGNQTHRKARRCWSPDLHRRFVNALHMLGGSQGKNMATPKQIRELMKVDGLTNDEVKSHLQKYRLHTRRPSPSPQASVAAGPQVVVLGGIWVPPEYAAAAAAHHHHGGAQAAAAMYGAHAAAAHHLSPSFCSPSAPPGQQELYPAIAPPPPPPNHQLHRHAIHHHHHQQHQQHLYNKPHPPSTRRNISPESDTRGGGAGDPSESIEDGKSESGSWKADSGGGGGDNGGERRRLDGEESNGSVVTLKF